MHGTSHYLGLDVHDVGRYGKLEPGQVITVEPGIYIPQGSPCDQKWWNIGVRIEDDILITNGKPVNLSGCVPREVEDIETLMLEKSRFNILPCDGTYFQTLDYSKISKKTDLEFAEELTEKYGVASIPVSVFSEKDKHKNMLRFCFAKQDDTIRKATNLLCKI